ncbi:unnamed protein product [Penicillium camemberti]|uniref:Str. FM013 n=1 Tax=Penicillium camemberti (strain FM 013) TaxID=1429867 RepID=A0A0G4PQ04_PENC3|nr:unnamed protein product [Penicillium camemberti]
MFALSTWKWPALARTDETRAITDFIRDQHLDLKKDAAKLPTKAVTDLELLEIPRLFFLTKNDPTDDELRPKDHEMVTLPAQLGILTDHPPIKPC